MVDAVADGIAGVAGVAGVGAIDATAATEATEATEAVTIDRARCDDCGKCLDACPTQVFDRDPGGRVVVRHPRDCHVCFLCVPDCPPQAITVSWDAPNHRHRSIYDVLAIDLTKLPA